MLFLPACLCAQDRPLTSLPYTPSLEPAFLDRSADPCVDFYQFACGNWNRLNPIPADQPRWDVYSKLQTDNLQFLWGILDEASKPLPDRTPQQQKIGDLFAACMDEAAVEKAGAAPLKARLDEIAALKRVSGIPALLGRLHLESSGDSALFGFGSSQDFADSNSVIAFAVAGGLGLPDRDYYVKADAKSQETRARYLQHLAAMFQLLGDAPAAAQAEARTVMAIETALAKASLTRVDKRDPYKLFHKYPRARLDALTPSFGWAAYFNAIGVPAPAEVNVTEPEFFREVEKQLKTRGIKDWKTYLRWHLAHGQSAYLSSAFVNASFEFYSKYLRGVTELQPRWKRCVRYVDRDLGEALGQVFAARTFTADTKARALEMTREIEKAMEADLRQLPWMGEATRQQALLKLHAIVNKIGYPDRWRDYSSIRIARDDFLGDVDRAIVFESKRQLAKIGKPVDRSEWQMTPPTVNAYYDPQMNNVNFPAGIMQAPFFNGHEDDAANYGDMGAVIGHELTHGFDDEGRQFDKDGNLKDWWTKDDEQKFTDRADCTVKQYDAIEVVPGVHLNGKLTLGENLADLGGLWLSWLAWFDKAETAHMDMHATTDGYTPDQRFWIAYAQGWCTQTRPEQLRTQAQSNPHSPEEFRTNSVLMNLPEFANSFSCKKTAAMVNPKPCRVW